MNNYTTFLQQKHPKPVYTGFDCERHVLNPMLFAWQQTIVRWALKLGRAALFEECGLGKTFQQLEWAKQVAQHTTGRVLIVAPLGVAFQTVEEAQKLGIDLRYCRTQTEADAAEPVVITNYDSLKNFNAEQFAGVVLDESSILKAYSGKTKHMILSMFAQTPFKLACTATPSPNDVLELGNHAEFLGLMPSSEMLARWFINDSMRSGNYRLKKHAEKDFWAWVTSWAVCISTPSDLGDYADDGFLLPALQVVEERIDLDVERMFEKGQMVPIGKLSATEIWAEKRATLQSRCERAAAIVAQSPNEPWIIWVETNDEADMLSRLISDAIEVRGNHTPNVKEAKLKAFSRGDARIIITKLDIAGFGMNWQHCGKQMFISATYSFERLYQGLRRSLRYGRTQPVTAYLIFAESEGALIDTLYAKQAQHTTMMGSMRHAMREHGLYRSDTRTLTHYQPVVQMQLPRWLNAT